MRDLRVPSEPFIVPIALAFPFMVILLLIGCGGGSGGGSGAAPLQDRPGAFVDLSLERLPLDHDFGQDAAVGDVDRDTRTDLVSSCWIMTPTIRVLPGSGTGEFRVDENPASSPEAYLSRMAVLDYDGDGDLDVAISADGGIHLLSNRSVR